MIGTSSLVSFLRPSYSRAWISELYCQLFVLLDVAFADDDLAVILLGKFADDRSQHAARTAPCCPEIYY